MPELTDSELLAEFARVRSEPAFTALVARHVHLVYSTAMRFTGNFHHAEEITQAVFIILARKAGKLSPSVVLSGWLYQTTRLTAASLRKSENRRRRREQEAYMQSIVNEHGTVWQRIEPLLDEVMGGLGEKDRDAVVLHFFENKTAAEIAAALNLTTAAAHKRVSRALEKLRKSFVKRGVNATAEMISLTISNNSVQAAPAALVKSVTAVALAKSAATSTSILTLIKGALKIMAWTKAKTAIVSVLIVSAVAFSVVQYRVVSELRRQNLAIRQQMDQLLQTNDRLSQLQMQNRHLSQMLAQSSNSEVLTKAHLNQLLQQRAQERKTTKVANDRANPPSQSSTQAQSVELPRDTWAVVGFSTPQAALRTRGWAVLNGDHKLFKQSLYFTDAARKIAEDYLVQMAENSTDPNKVQGIQYVLNHHWGLSDAILMPMMTANQNNPFADYKILSQQSSSPDEMTLKVETDTVSGPPTTDTLNFERFGNDWKVVIDKKAIENMIQQ